MSESGEHAALSFVPSWGQDMGDGGRLGRAASLSLPSRKDGFQTQPSFGGTTKARMALFCGLSALGPCKQHRELCCCRPGGAVTAAPMSTAGSREKTGLFQRLVEKSLSDHG